MSALDSIRAVVKPEYREKFYNLVGAAVALLGAFGLAGDNTAATVAQLVLAAAALLFAILYSTSTVRTALYGVLAAAQAVAALYSIGNDATWAGVLSIAAAVLGTQVAAGRTPAPYDIVTAALGGIHRTETRR